MSMGKVVVPDSIEPVVGYREFSVEPYDKDLRSTSMGYNYKSGENVARCRSNFHLVKSENAVQVKSGDKTRLSHTVAIEDRQFMVPSEPCSCGFYAYKTIELLIGAHNPYMRVNINSTISRNVRARVSMYGRVVEHENGYRSEKLKIDYIVGSSRNPELMKLLADKYGVVAFCAPAVLPFDYSMHKAEKRFKEEAPGTIVFLGDESKEYHLRSKDMLFIPDGIHYCAEQYPPPPPPPVPPGYQEVRVKPNEAISIIRASNQFPRKP